MKIYDLPEILGRNARQMGLGTYANPYAKNSSKYAWWLWGWNEGA